MTPRRSGIEVNPLFSRPGEATERPRFSLADAPMLPETAYQIVHDEAMLDGNARLNLATFVTTWMDRFANLLYAETYDKNMIDKDEYPLTAAIEERCWKILAGLWHAPDPHHAMGTSTIGSSEACMLGGLALKRLARPHQLGGPLPERPDRAAAEGGPPDDGIPPLIQPRRARFTPSGAVSRPLDGKTAGPAVRTRGRRPRSSGFGTQSAKPY